MTIGGRADMNNVDLLPLSGAHDMSYCMKKSSRLALLLSVLVIIGCGGGPEGPKRYAISGTVTREGKPIREGVIQMVPTVQGPAVQAAIVEGKYEFTDANGPVEGEQVVTILRVLEKVVPPGVAPKEVDPLPETGFKSPMPPAGWVLRTTISPDQDLSQPVDFNVDNAEPPARRGR